MPTTSSSARWVHRATRTALVAGLVGLVAAPAHALSTRVLLSPAGGVSENLGIAVAAGDVNGDGHADFIAASSSGPSSLGHVYVYFGGPGADATADLIYTSPTAGSGYGSAVASAGDVNGDGCDDVIVGAPWDDTPGTDAGRAFLYFGGRIPDTVVDLTFSGLTPSDNFGCSVAGAGNFNGDGYDDIVVGAYRADDFSGPEYGSATIFYGGAVPNNTADLTFNPFATATEYGVSVAGGGDFNGDGLDDIVVGAPRDDASGSDWGRAYVYLGTPTGAGSVASMTLSSNASHFTLGARVAFAGDLNGDGYDDIVAGAPYDLPVGGRAAIFLGGHLPNGVLDYSVEGTMSYDYFGVSVAGPGDVNGDGYDDLVVGASREGGVSSSSYVGAAYLYLGGATFDLTADLVWTLGNPGDRIGEALARIGDFDGDGRDDLAIGGSGVGANGGAFVVSAFPYRVLSPNGGEQWVAGRAATVRWEGRAIADVQLSLDGGFTWSTRASGVGGSDTNELALVAPATASAGAKVRLVYTGQAAGLATADESDAVFAIAAANAPPHAAARLRHDYFASGMFDGMGSAVSGAGDVNGDGFTDYLVAAGYSDTPSPDAGRVYLHLGGPADDGVPDLTLSGVASGDMFGAALGAAGDLNRDGFGDFIIGAPGNDTGALDGGRAYLYFGGATPNGIADLFFNGTVASQYFGTAVGSAGDMNGDGYPDLYVGDNHSGGSLSRLFVYFSSVVPAGVADITLSSGVLGDFFGNTAAGIGDFNGDGFDDLAVGAQGASVTGSLAGMVQVFLGGVAPDATADLTFHGPGVNAVVGRSLAAGGDWNGDGFDDLLVGSPGGPEGRAFLLHGGPSPDAVPDLVFQGGIGDVLGQSVALGTDVNRDGYDDVAIGVLGANVGGVGAGQVSVYFGGPGADAEPDLIVHGFAAEEGLGAAVALPGDVSGDGFPDLLAGAPNSSAGGFYSGAAYLFECGRYFVTAPNGGETWNVGATQTISWLGAEPADLWLSVDAGRTWDRLRSGVGGEASNTVSLRVPHAPTKFAMVKVTPAAPDVIGEDASDARFTILSSVALLNFTATLEGTVAELSWNTDPGPAALAGYRVYRSVGADAGGGERIGPELITENRYSDSGAVPGARYRLVAVNGLLQELELGQVSLAPARPLAVSPSPLRTGDLSITFAVYGLLGSRSGEVELELYDVTGRRRATIARGSFAAGHQTVRWNGRDDSGMEIPGGVYFLRARSAGIEHRVRVVVAR
jgi:hypothetical protein